MTRWTQVSRGMIAASVSTFVAALSHQAAGGTLPSAPALMLCLAFCALVCIPLAGKTLSPTRLAIAVAASQAMFHGFFGLLSAPTAYLGSTGAHDHGAVVIPLGGVTEVMTMDHASAAMIAAHIGAAAITFLALNFGERAVLALCQLGRLAVSRILGKSLAAPRLVTTAFRVPLDVSGVRPRQSLRMLSTMRWRGPPRLAIG